MRAVAVLAFITSLLAHAAAPLDLKDGDRVVLLGGTFVERDVQFGQLELALTLAYRDKNITFRNLGWSGDTVWGHARAVFGSTQDGYNNMQNQVADTKPSVLFVCYGMSESFDGEAALPAFVAQYNKLLDDLAKTGARFVLVSPTQHEKLPEPLPDPAEHNKMLVAYTAAIKDIAAKRNALFVDLYNAPRFTRDMRPLTENGIHLNEHGYLNISRALAMAVAGNAGGAGETVKLRNLIVEKNTLFFHRWRPQNDTYIFGFRKKEQGRNAVDIPKFDPLVEEKEKEIAALKTQK